MKLVTYRMGEEASRLGVYWESLIVDVEEFGFNVGLDLPASMLDFIDLGPIAVSALSEALSHSKVGDFLGVSVPALNVQLLAPIPRPKKNIFGIIYGKLLKLELKN